MPTQSKLANMLFTRELATRLKQAGVSNVAVVACHPGVIPGTQLFRHMPIPKLLTPFLMLFLKTVPQGTATQVWP
jgi:NAD(P)-dependent dehydrogenase (short-subunit alcohol dehydrogenase family)